jgi:hypothetical protein
VLERDLTPVSSQQVVLKARHQHNFDKQLLTPTFAKRVAYFFAVTAFFDNVTTIRQSEGTLSVCSTLKNELFSAAVCSAKPENPF